MTKTSLHSPALSQTTGTGAAPHLRPTRHSRTSHGTDLSAPRLSHMVALGAAHILPYSTHGPSCAALATTAWIFTDPSTATQAHAHPARDAAAYGSQITAATRSRGAFSTAAAMSITTPGAVISPINPAGAGATIDTATTAAAAMTQIHGASPNCSIPAWSMPLLHFTQ